MTKKFVLLCHCLDIATSQAHFISEQITVMYDPGFQNMCQSRVYVLVYFVFNEDFCD